MVSAAGQASPNPHVCCKGPESTTYSCHRWAWDALPDTCPPASTAHISRFQVQGAPRQALPTSLAHFSPGLGCCGFPGPSRAHSSPPAPSRVPTFPAMRHPARAPPSAGLAAGDNAPHLSGMWAQVPASLPQGALRDAASHGAGGGPWNPVRLLSLPTPADSSGPSRAERRPCSERAQGQRTSAPERRPLPCRPPAPTPRRPERPPE